MCSKQDGIKLPICMAKHNIVSLIIQMRGLQKTLKLPFVIGTKLGAGFIVALTGDVMTMPGLPKHVQPLLIWMLKAIEQF